MGLKEPTVVLDTVGIALCLGYYIGRCRFVEKHFLGPPSNYNSRRSSINFPKERPSCQDWETWEAFWRHITNKGLVLRSLLGNYQAPTHRGWLWFKDQEAGTLQQVTPKRVNVYFPQGHG